MALKFKSGKEMYDYICEGNDIYSKSERTYTFVYNDAGAICIYTLDDEDVARLVTESKEYNDYWCAFLGWKGSNILDDGEYDNDEYRYSEDWEKNKLYLRPSLEFCEETYKVTDWIDCKDVEVTV